MKTVLKPSSLLPTLDNDYLQSSKGEHLNKTAGAYGYPNKVIFLEPCNYMRNSELNNECEGDGDGSGSMYI